MMYLTLFLATFLLSVILTLAIKLLAKKFKIIDRPAVARKPHYRPVPLLGGWAIFLATALILFWQRDFLVSGNLQFHHWWGVLVGAILLMIGGTLDDKFNLSSGKQIIWPILASLAVVVGGVGIEKITNPIAGFLYLNQWQIPLGKWDGQTHYWVVLTDTFTVLWLMGMMYTTKLLDGVDGLVSGVSAIGALIIFLFTMTTRYYQPDIALAALVFAGACLGFLMLNWHPAKIFLGEGGSLFLGFLLGVLSIISGGKIAIALLIMGIPILDVVWTIIRRWRSGQNPFKTADRQHLHFRLLDSGWGVRRTVLLFYLLAIVFGLSALFLQSRGKILSLLVLGVIMLAIIGWFNYLDRKNKLV
jgi:UDP-GlcNAc:undecaprenyl-phosphate GlcNAc-1-phosphate transferase